MKLLKIIGIILGIVLGIALTISMPLIVDLLFELGTYRPLISTRFGHESILVYMGAVLPFFATIGYVWLLFKQNKQNKELQEQSNKLIETNRIRDLQASTFAYLIIIKIESTADYSPVKTYKLEKAVPWPLDARANTIGYPNGIPNYFPKHWKKKLEKNLPPLPLGNSDDFRESEVADKVFFHFKSESGENWLSIDPSEGIFYAGNKSQLVLWQKNFPLPRYYRYYTQFGFDFYAKSSRENIIVDIIEIHGFSMTLLTKENKLYFFEDRLHYFDDIIRKPLIVKATEISENSYHRKKYNCDHFFSVELHLCHDYAALLTITDFIEIDIQFDAVYINQSGVRTNRKQGFKIGALVKKTVESRILGSNGMPMKYTVVEEAELQHYPASKTSIELSTEIPTG